MLLNFSKPLGTKLYGKPDLIINSYVEVGVWIRDSSHLPPSSYTHSLFFMDFGGYWTILRFKLAHNLALNVSCFMLK